MLLNVQPRKFAGSVEVMQPSPIWPFLLLNQPISITYADIEH